MSQNSSKKRNAHMICSAGQAQESRAQLQEGIHTERVGPDLGVELPSANPLEAVDEVFRRTDVSKDPGVDVTVPDEVAAAKRAAFMRDYGGFWVVNFANEKFSTQCMCPNVRLLAYESARPRPGQTPQQATAEAYLRTAQRVNAFMRDERVTSVPAIVPANEPFLIPFSEATARSAQHTLAKMERAKARFNEFVKFRDAEFKRHVAEQKPGDTGMSDYHRRKTYLLRKKLLEHRRNPSTSTLTPAEIEALEKLFPDSRKVSRETYMQRQRLRERARGDEESALMAGDAGVLDDALELDVTLPAFGDSGGRDLNPHAATTSVAEAMRAATAAQELQRMQQATAAAAAAASASGSAIPEVGEELTAAAPVVVPDGALPEVGIEGVETESKSSSAQPSTPAGSNDILDGFRNPTQAPGQVWQGELPAHWARAPDGRPRSADDWPRDLEARHGKYAVVTFVDDLDKPEDSPEFPEAAGVEPMMVIFGGMFEDVDLAKDHMRERIGPWAKDIILDAVDMYEWLYPTEVDPDLMQEEHRTQHAGFTKELNTVMGQRKKTIKMSAEARAQAAATGGVLAETNVNSLPDITEVVAAERPGMFLQAPTEQYDDEGRRIVDSTLKGPKGALPEAS